MTNRLLRPTRGREIRASKGITAYVGANGSGKTTAMAWDTIPTLEAGLPVLSTVRLLDYRDPRPCEDPECGFATELFIPGTSCDKDDPNRHRQAHPLWVPLTSWLQVMAWKRGDILLDEVSGVASSRDHHSMPSEVGNHLQQLRKGDCITRWTAPAWGRADTIIRSCTAQVVSARGFFPKEATADETGYVRRWRQNRLFMWRSFDAYEFEDFTVAKRDTLKTTNTDRHWGPGSPAFDLFDTYAKALHIGTVSVSGTCAICGGSRPRPRCKGHDGDDMAALAAEAGGPHEVGSGVAA